MSAWQDTAVSILRVLINDLSSTPDYTTCKLEELLCVAAHFIVQEIDFTTAYTVSIPATTISPDPVDDVDFINFMVLKAACLVDQSTFRTKAALEGIKVQCGPANLAIGGNIRGFQILLEKGPCMTYQELKKDYQFGDINIIKGIFSPFVSNTFSPSDNYGPYYDDDGRRSKYF